MLKLNQFPFVSTYHYGNFYCSILVISKNLSKLTFRNCVQVIFPVNFFVCLFCLRWASSKIGSNENYFVDLAEDEMLFQSESPVRIVLILRFQKEKMLLDIF